jgi:hypothetical protein
LAGDAAIAALAENANAAATIAVVMLDLMAHSSLFL